MDAGLGKSRSRLPTGGKYGTQVIRWRLQTTLQRLIDKICEVYGATVTLQGLYDTLPLNYPISRGAYPCVGNLVGYSDLENLYEWANATCSKLGTTSQITQALAYDCYVGSNVSGTIAESLKRL